MGHRTDAAFWRMTPAQVYYISGSHVQRRQHQLNVHGPNAEYGSVADLMSMS